MSAPLHLESYFVEQLEYLARPDFDRGKPAEETRTIDWQVLQHKESKDRFMLKLRVELSGDGTRNARCRVLVGLVGFFLVEAECKGQQRADMLNLNAPSILYGIARQLVTDTTANGPWGKVFLPTADFVELARDKASRDRNREAARAPRVSERPRASARRKSKKP